MPERCVPGNGPWTYCRSGNVRARGRGHPVVSRLKSNTGVSGNCSISSAVSLSRSCFPSSMAS